MISTKIGAEEITDFEGVSTILFVSTPGLIRIFESHCLSR